MFALKRAGGLFDGAATRWRVGDGREVKTTFRAPDRLVLEHWSARLEVEVFWYSPLPVIERPHFICPACRLGAYHLYLEAFRCRRCAGLDYSSRHINRHTPQIARLARLRKKINASPEPFSGLPALMSLRPSRRKLVARILVLEQGVLASMAAVGDDLEARLRRGKLSA